MPPGTALLAGLTVLFLGDSITGGTGAAAEGGFVAHVVRAHPEWTIHVVGCPGASSADWVRSSEDADEAGCALGGAFEALAASYTEVDVVHVLIGTNDAIGFLEDAPLSAAEFATNVEALARRFAGDVIVSLPPPAPKPYGRTQRRLDNYAKALRARAEAPDAAFRLGADFGALDRKRLLGVHPDGTGHAWMARRLSSTLDRLSPPPGRGSSPAADHAAEGSRSEDGG